MNCQWTSASECQMAHERGQHRTRRQRQTVEYVERGAAIAGTGKPSASSKATGKGK